jgi:hypothetical protein
VTTGRAAIYVFPRCGHADPGGDPSGAGAISTAGFTINTLTRWRHAGDRLVVDDASCAGEHTLVEEGTPRLSCKRGMQEILRSGAAGLSGRVFLPLTFLPTRRAAVREFAVAGAPVVPPSWLSRFAGAVRRRARDETGTACGRTRASSIG